jgi:hypothetical protein
MGRNLLIDDVRPPKSKTGFQNRSGGRFQGQKPSYGKSAGPRGKSGSGTRGKSSQRSDKNGPTRQRDSDYSERTLRSAPRPEKKDTLLPGKTDRVKLHLATINLPRKKQRPGSGRVDPDNSSNFQILIFFMILVVFWKLF